GVAAAVAAALHGAESRLRPLTAAWIDLARGVLRVSLGVTRAAVDLAPDREVLLGAREWARAVVVDEAVIGASELDHRHRALGIAVAATGPIDAVEIDRRHASDDVASFAGEFVGHAAAVRTPRGVDALRVDARLARELFDHRAHEAHVVGRVSAALACVPSVVDALWIDGEKPLGVGDVVPVGEALLLHAGPTETMEVEHDRQRRRPVVAGWRMHEERALLALGHDRERRVARINRGCVAPGGRRRARGPSRALAPRDSPTLPRCAPRSPARPPSTRTSSP